MATVTRPKGTGGRRKAVRPPKDDNKVVALSGTVERRLHALASELVSRSQLAGRLGLSYGTQRDIYQALGYNKIPTWEDYYARYERGDVGKRVVDAPVNATWRGKPKVTESEQTETQFERDWSALVRECKAYHYLQRADRISRIGEFGVILLGFDDGKPLNEPVERAGELLYMRPYSQGSTKIIQLANDPNDERYGMPELYQLGISSAKTPDMAATLQTPVHYSRVIHVAEDLFENEIYGTPALQCVLNRLQDLELVAGGSAEMYWRGAFPGLVFSAQSDAQFISDDMTDLQNEIEAYVHDLQRWLKVQGIDVKEIMTQVADPTSAVDVQLTLIASATGIPKRILTGAERGELASSQDETNWNTRVDERRKDHAELIILRPFIDRLIEYSVLAPPGPEGYAVEWPDIFAPSAQEQAETGKTKTEALAAYSNSIMAADIVPPEIFLEHILGFTQEQIVQIQEMQTQRFADDGDDDLDEE